MQIHIQIMLARNRSSNPVPHSYILTYIYIYKRIYTHAYIYMHIPIHTYRSCWQTQRIQARFLSVEAGGTSLPSSLHSLPSSSSSSILPVPLMDDVEGSTASVGAARMRSRVSRDRAPGEYVVLIILEVNL